MKRDAALPRSIVDDAFLARVEALKRAVRQAKAALRADPDSLVLQTQLYTLQRTLGWHERRTASVRNVSARTLGRSHARRPRCRRVVTSDHPL